MNETPIHNLKVNLLDLKNNFVDKTIFIIDIFGKWQLPFANTCTVLIKPQGIKNGITLVREIMLYSIMEFDIMMSDSPLTP